ncbi:MAG TPA: hypothetical protein EYQ84_04410 [Nitrospinaceae bacterium]|jgi:hypothetical protein|nr:hypothetical protein [Nitrospinaceae bacterium]HIL26074.1 hypothetical protein [Nitrospinaceae bacterium]
MTVKSILLLFFCLLITPRLILAHGGDHKEEKKTTSLTEKNTSLNESIYSVDVGKSTEFPSIESSPLMDSPFSNNSLSGTSLVDDTLTNDSMERFKQKTNSGEHDQHQTQHVEESLHEWVSPNAKGYSVAISMTILSGLVFMGLSFFRIGEKDS